MSKTIEVECDPKSMSERTEFVRAGLHAFDDMKEDGEYLQASPPLKNPLEEIVELEVDFELIAGYSEEEAAIAAQNVLNYDEDILK